MRLKSLCIGALCACLPLAAQAAEATYLGSFTWHGEGVNFGGFSGLEISDDGATFASTTDRGYLVTGRLVRAGDAMTAIEAGAPVPLMNSDGSPLGRYETDSEGLAWASDGTLYVSFEGDHRLMAFSAGGDQGRELPRAPDFAALQLNSGLEALAIGPDGALYAVPERSGRQDVPFPVYRFLDGRWDVAFHIPRLGPYLAVGADIAPDGTFYLLERDFVGIGFRSRVRRFGLDGSGGDTLIETHTGEFDNLEGIAVWHDGAGTRLTMISDDNFRLFQRTQLVEYRVTD